MPPLTIFPAGKLRYANNSQYKDDTMIRKEVSRCSLLLSPRIALSRETLGRRVTAPETPLAALPKHVRLRSPLHICTRACSIVCVLVAHGLFHLAGYCVHLFYPVLRQPDSDCRAEADSGR